MSQNGRKMAKMLHNAAKKFDWDRTEFQLEIDMYSCIAVISVFTGSAEKKSI